VATTLPPPSHYSTTPLLTTPLLTHIHAYTMGNTTSSSTSTSTSTSSSTNSTTNTSTSATASLPHSPHLHTSPVASPVASPIPTDIPSKKRPRDDITHDIHDVHDSHTHTRTHSLTHTYTRKGVTNDDEPIKQRRRIHRKGVSKIISHSSLSSSYKTLAGKLLIKNCRVWQWVSDGVVLRDMHSATAAATGMYWYHCKQHYYSTALLLHCILYNVDDV
jgi:hypothetical protein